VPIAFLAFATPISGTLEKLGAGPAPSQAATNPLLDQRVATNRCVAAWNSAASRQWRAVASASGAQIAQVGATLIHRRHVRVRSHAAWPRANGRFRRERAGHDRSPARAHDADTAPGLVRNEGRLAIRGAIASLEVYGPARPGRPWWRSKPVTIPRLAPGATATVRFDPPALGHGARLIRATTAAIECETRFSDNSPVFRVHAS
jgi:hypothetical protein